MELIVAARQQNIYERQSYTDGLTLKLQTSFHLMCSARLTPWTFDWDNKIKQLDINFDDLMLYGANKCQ